jgi:hypothetical protein
MDPEIDSNRRISFHPNKIGNGHVNSCQGGGHFTAFTTRQNKDGGINAFLKSF